MPIVHLDFETRSAVDIKTCGAGRYAADPSTRILCACWAVDNGPVMGSYGEEVPRLFYQAIKEGWKFSAFNAMFEQLIWSYRWPTLPLPEFICTRALVASHGLPQGLDRACKALHIGVSKDIEGARLIKTYSVPGKDGVFNELKGEDKEKMLRYCAKDIALSRRILQRLPALPAQEQEVYNWTVKANLRGVSIDGDLAKNAESISRELQTRGNKSLAALTEGTIFSVSQIARIQKYLRAKFNLGLESLDKEAIAEALLDTSLAPDARRILELRRDLSQTSVQKFARASASICADGKIRDTLIYHGASTGRWTSQVVQFQNLPKYTLSDPDTAMRFIKMGDADMFELGYKAPMLALSACVRGLIIPSPGHEFVVIDYAAIEARVLLWMAGQEDAVAAFHAGQDIYVDMARAIYNNKKLTKENKKERQLGKQAVLGCGYGMGAKKFEATCKGYGIEVTEELAGTAVDAYRRTYRRVPAFWNDVEQAVRSCVVSGKAYKLGALVFSRVRDFLYIQLPSGRKLAYHNMAMDGEGLYYYTEDSQTYSYVKKHTYGGRLVENIIQATARDILATGILNLEAAGFPVVMTVHDENVIEVKEGTEVEPLIKIMCRLPEWAHGCPISAEGFRCSRYRKG